MEKKVLVTICAPSAGGKSYLFNYIRDVAKLPCLISTTTRPPREGEKEGVDYFFISEEESKRLEAEEQFAELAIYRGVRYGVTKQEFHSKLDRGVAFLIVEPSGIEHYAKPAIDVGAKHLKVWVHVDPEIRMQRFIDRGVRDITAATGVEAVTKVFKSYLDRQLAMLTEEVKWFSMVQWDRIVFGTDTPERNLEIILNDAFKL